MCHYFGKKNVQWEFQPLGKHTQSSCMKVYSINLDRVHISMHL